MCTIIAEADISYEKIAETLEDAGWDVTPETKRMMLETEDGLGFALNIDTNRKFICFHSNFKTKTGAEESVELANKLNEEVFLPNFHFYKDRIYVSYFMSYERGLITAQFMRIVRRFAMTLDRFIDEYNEDRAVFDLGSSDEATAAPPAVLQ